MCEEKKSYKIEIFITIIALATALISNWDKIIPKEEEAKHPNPKKNPNPTLIELPASFDCRKAQTKIEIIICKNPSISHADGQLGILYKQVKHKVSENKYKNIKKEQRLWIEQRDNKIINICQSTVGLDVDCVVRIYNQRAYEFKKILTN